MTTVEMRVTFAGKGKAVRSGETRKVTASATTARVSNGERTTATASNATNATSTAAARARTTLARMLAVAHCIARLIDTGAIRDHAEAARRLGVTRARASQLARLCWLAPSIQERILLDDTFDVHERDLRSVFRHIDWRDQDRALAQIVERKRANRTRNTANTSAARDLDGRDDIELDADSDAIISRTEPEPEPT